MAKETRKNFRQCLAAAVLLIVLSQMPAYSQTQPEVSSSISISIDLQSGCIPTATVGCPGSVTAHLNWSKSRAFPYSAPSPIGYWGGFVFKQATAGGGATIIGGPPDYSGSSHIVTVIGGNHTPQGISYIINSVYAAGWYAFTTYIDPNGVPHTISSTVPPPLVQNIGDLAWAEEPNLEDKTLTNEHNLSCAGDPVYLHNGQFSYECGDLEIPGRKLDVNLRHSYLNGQTFNGPFGYGWFINYYMRLHKLRNGDAVIVGGDGRKVRYTYSAGSFTSPAGRYEALVQNANGTYTLTMAQADKYQFDAGGKLTAIEDRNGNTILLAYSSTEQPFTGFSQFSQSPTTRIQIGLDYRLQTLTDTTGRIITFNYNPDGLLASIVEGTRQITFTYDSNTNDLLTVTRPATPQYPLGLTKTFTYDAEHQLETITDPKNQTFVTNHYDTEGRVQTQDLGAGSFVFDYSVPGQTTVTDRNTNVVQYGFNGTGNVIVKTEFTRGIRPTDPPSFTTAYTYNSDMERTSVTFPRGNGIKYTYDSANPAARSHGNLLEVRRKEIMSQPDNNAVDLVTTLTYEANFNQAKTIIDPRGYVTTLTYDYEMPPTHILYGTKGNLVMVQYPATPGGTPTEQFLPNQHGQVALAIDPNGVATQYDYYSTTGYLQRIIQDPGALNAATVFTYDNFGYFDLVTDAENHTTDLDHNELGWLVQVKNPLNFRTKYSYDKNGNVEKVERQANAQATQWQTTNFTYTSLNKLRTVTDPLNRLTTFNYDNNENRTSVVDAANLTTDYEYDERDLLFKVRDANAPVRGVTQYDYDINANLSKITDANANATNYTNDLFDRRLTETFPDTKFTEFEYDKNSNLKKVTRGKPLTPKVVEYDYDPLNRLIAKRFPATTSLSTTYQYDLGSRLTLSINAQQTLGYFYNNLNQVWVAGQIYGNNQLALLFYGHDKVGNRRSVTYPSGKLVEYTYDAADRLHQVKVGGVLIAQHDWDLLDRRNQVIEYLSPNAKTQTAYGFDIANQLKQISHVDAAGSSFAQFDYPVYDNVGNRLAFDITRPSGNLNMGYGYNNIYELTQVTGSQSHTYQYDLVGNRLNVDGTVYVPNVVNQYTQVGTQQYSYDDSGNLINDGTNAYTYDEENRLSDVSNQQAAYTYDGLNRRVSKTVGAASTYFIYDGDREIEERDANGTLLADYVHGENIDEVLTMTRGGNTYFYYYDGLGSVTDLLDTAGNVVESYDYDVFGQPTALSTVGNPYYFTGRRFDPESGKQHQRARTYDYLLGRFHQRDPLGYFDSMNPYQYALNSPANFIDPYGLDSYIATQFGHEYLVVDDPDNPGGFVVFDFFPHPKASAIDVLLFKAVQGKINQQRLGPGKLPTSLFFLPFTRKRQSLEEDRKTIDRARLLMQAVEFGDIKYRLGINNFNCIGFAYGAQQGGQ